MLWRDLLLIQWTLNRRAHYHRALEEAVSSNWFQWPKSFEHKNPLNGGKTFTGMSPAERVSTPHHRRRDIKAGYNDPRC